MRIDISFPKDLRRRVLIIGGASIALLFIYSEYQIKVAQPAMMIEQLCFYRGEIDLARVDLDNLDDYITKPMDEVDRLLLDMANVCDRGRPNPNWE